jgi:hypothetical protein
VSGYPGGSVGAPTVERSNLRRTFINVQRVGDGCGSLPCDWCHRTSVWLAYDIGYLTGASCDEHVGLLRRSVAMSNGTAHVCP